MLQKPRRAHKRVPPLNSSTPLADEKINSEAAKHVGAPVRLCDQNAQRHFPFLSTARGAPPERAGELPPLIQRAQNSPSQPPQFQALV